MTLEQIKAILDLGGTVVLAVVMGYGLKILWQKLEQKDLQITDELTKREALLRESIDSSKTVITAIHGIAEAIEKIESRRQ